MGQPVLFLNLKLVKIKECGVRLPFGIGPKESRIVRLITLFMAPFNGALSTQAAAVSWCLGFDLKIIYMKVLTIW